VVEAGAAHALRCSHAEPARFELRVRDEAGETRERAGRATPRRDRLVLPLPRLAPGIHRVALRLASASGTREAEQTLFVTPRRCAGPREMLGARPAFGLWANLYALRGAGGLGVGHLGDLGDLVRFAAEAGADFVGVNPLHALRNRAAEISPYAPLSRLFRNPLCLDVEALPELAASPEARRRLGDERFRRELAGLRAARWIDYERSVRLLARLLEPLHEAFRKRAAPARRCAFAAYRAEAGEALEGFATFLALEERLAAEGAARDWRRWPARFRDPRSPALAAFRARHARAVERHAFVQFALDAQLAGVAAEARRRGLRLGLYTDLAIGSAPSGFDAWRFRELLVPGVEMGAPPDAYNRAGQGWGFAPLDPTRLAEGGFSFVARLLRANLRHAGAIRIDHVLGMFRQWWVPPGTKPAEGAYVRFPARALLGLVALEARRAGALAIGEDLGVVPPEVPSLLARHGLLSSRVMLFERDRRGSFRPASRYSRRALVTANTHDLPPLAGWCEGRDLEIRRALGLASAAGHARARRERAAECRRLLARLRRDGHLPRGTREPTAAERLRAVNRFLCATPAPLVGIALDDLAGEREPVNVPGVPPDRHPCWRRRLVRTLAALAEAADTRYALAGAARRARR
jgi:4-alpha-glucanotransferase